MVIQVPRDPLVAQDRRVQRLETLEEQVPQERREPLAQLEVLGQQATQVRQVLTQPSLVLLDRRALLVQLAKA